MFGVHIRTFILDLCDTVLVLIHQKKLTLDLEGTVTTVQPPYLCRHKYISVRILFPHTCCSIVLAFEVLNNYFLATVRMYVFLVYELLLLLSQTSLKA